MVQFIAKFEPGHIRGQPLAAKGRSGGVFFNDQLLERVLGAREVQDYPPPTSPNMGRLAVGVYCGYFVPLFGHFIAEFLPRYEQVRMQGEIKEPILVHPAPFLVDPHKQLSNSNLITQFLTELELPFSRLHFCTNDIIVEQLYYTSNVINLFESVDEDVVEISKSLNRRYLVSSRDRKIFFSRSRLKEEARKSVNAEEVDRLFLAQGFEVLHPQEMSIKDQIFSVCSARCLAGEEGSALHLSLFNPFLETCVILDSGRFTRAGAIPDTQKLLNDRLNCKTVYCLPTWSSGGAMQVGGRFVVDIPTLEEILAMVQ
ncbi:glycosyltransferase 61 family protein [Acidocella sp.]|uniref:glycosyltransferase 61 family protein n=1 Tax=Acidocella sp. TaxID=50710 RepID=UPI002F42D285